MRSPPGVPPARRLGLRGAAITVTPSSPGRGRESFLTKLGQPRSLLGAPAPPLLNQSCWSWDSCGDVPCND